MARYDSQVWPARGMKGQTSVDDSRHVHPRGIEPVGQAGRQRGLAADPAELEHDALPRQVIGDRFQGGVLPAPAGDQVQVVGADGARAQELERAKRHQPLEPGGRQGQGRQRHQLGPVAHGEQEQASASAQVGPPRVQPVPGEEEGVRIAGLEQRVPFRGQPRELRRLDTPHGQRSMDPFLHEIRIQRRGLPNHVLDGESLGHALSPGVPEAPGQIPVRQDMSDRPGQRARIPRRGRADR